MADRKKNSTYARNEESIVECDLTYAINKIGGRWKLQILDKLENGKLRFSELKKAFPLITERMLTLQLRALEKDGLIKRTVYATVPPR
ncbi:MAG TPA: winged helix-turn-helix transcriptional regulator [Cyclobacteriaceae bacterium]